VLLEKFGEYQGYVLYCIWGIRFYLW